MSRVKKRGLMLEFQGTLCKDQMKKRSPDQKGNKQPPEQLEKYPKRWVSQKAGKQSPGK